MPHYYAPFVHMLAATIGEVVGKGVTCSGGIISTVIASILASHYHNSTEVLIMILVYYVWHSVTSCIAKLIC